MITLTLLHPVQATPVQSWTFEQESVLRIGRATDNHVILYSAVVSRHHVELRHCTPGTWEIVSLGANGTYLDGKQITQVPVINGTIIRLARSGPNLQIHFDTEPSAILGHQDRRALSPTPTVTPPAGPEAQSLAAQPPATDAPRQVVTASQTGADTVLIAPRTQLDTPALKAEGLRRQVARHETLFDVKIPRDRAAPPVGLSPCRHGRAGDDMLFCPDCGQPVHVLRTLGDYQILKTLGSNGLVLTQLAWRQGQNLLIKSLEPRWSHHPEAIAGFSERARILASLHHPNLPRAVEFLTVDHQPYWVMEQSRGQNLRQLITAQGPLSQPQAIALITQVCDVLVYLHQQSPPLIHKALKPEHLLYQVLAPGVHRVTVNGLLALPAPMKQSVAANGAAKNGYAAPEQTLEHTASPSLDLFALGLVLLYLLTGQEPQAFYATRDAGAGITLPDLPGVTLDLLAILQKLTEPLPIRRYATAQEVVEALSQIG